MKIDFAGFARHEKKLIKRVFSAAKKPRCAVCVVCVDEQSITALNGKHRQVDAPTDVLSFPTNETPFLGDIAICREVMERQADDYGHGQKRELAFLALHGLLHLLGYDHGEEMDKLTEETLTRAGYERKL